VTPTARFPLATLIYFLQTPATLPTVTEATTHLGLKTSEWIMIVAVIIGPVLAVVTQIVVQRRTEKRDQKIWVFGTLMSLRASMLATDFVRALNYIDVVFYKNQKVRERWKTLLTHLSSEVYKADVIADATIDKTRDLLAELLAEIAKDLHYQYDHTHIKENSYYPKWHGQIEEEATALRQLGIAVLKGEASIRVAVSEQPPLQPQVVGRRPS
jgi:hypothetical protein